MSLSRVRLGILGFALVLASRPLSSAPLSGRVVDSEGKPVGGATVSWFAVRALEQRLLDRTRGLEPTALGELRTDSDGRFRINAQKPDPIFLRVFSSGPSVELADPFDPSEDFEELDIQIPAARKVRGRVVDESGKAVAGARIRIQADADAEESVAYAETVSGPDGAFALEAAPDGSASLTASRTGLAPAEVTGREAKAFATVVLRRGGGVEGRVLSPAGKPAAHSIVVANDLLAVETDSAGHYAFESLPEGAATLRVTAKDNLLARRDGVRIRKRAIATVDLPLAASAGITGLVLDEKSRRPIPGARVTAARLTPFDRTRKPAGSGRTDSRGRFRVLGLLPTDYTVAASSPGYVRSAVPGVVAGVAQPGSVSMVLRKGGSIAGRVTSESGSPVPGARVRIVPGMNRRAMLARGVAPEPRPVFTSADGTFRVRGILPAPDMAIEASREGYVPARRTGLPVRSGETTGGVALVLRRGADARGRVLDAQGQAVADAEIRLARLEVSTSRDFVADPNWNEIRPSARSGPDGAFRAASLDAGQYTARVTRPGYAAKTVGSLEVKKKDVNEWAPFILLPSATVAGVVRNTKGEPVSGARVSAETESLSADSLTDVEGRFRADGFLAGQSVFVYVTADGYGSARQSAAAPSETVVIRLAATAAVQGRVEDAETRRAIETFRVDWHTPRNSGMGIGGPNQDFHAADGAFELTGVRPGNVELEGTAEGYLPGLSQIELAEGETRTEVVLSLRRGKAVSGRVLDSVRGTGVPNASVYWSTADAGDARWFVSGASGSYSYIPNGTTTDADGKFSFDGLPAARLQFKASHPDFLEASKVFDTSNESSVSLTLSAGGSIAGTVVDASGHTAVGGAAVSLTVVGGAPSMSSGDDTTADAAGAFQFSHLKEGRYGLLARSTGGQSSKKEVALGSDQSQTGVQLEIASGTLLRGQVTGLPPVQLGGMSVSAFSAQPGMDPQERFYAQTASDEQGRFLIQNVPPGVLKVSASVSWPGRSVSKSVEIPAGAEEFPVEIAFTGSSRLSGRVTRRDVGIAGLQAGAQPDPPSSGSVRASAITDGDGQFAFDGLTDGSYKVSFEGEGVRVVRSVTVSGDTTYDLALPGTTLSGIVTESSSGNPLDGVAVRAESGKGQNAYDAKRAMSDSAGRYTITDLDPDSYQVTAGKDGYASKTQPAAVGDTSVAMDFALSKASGLTIHAVDAATGQPLTGVDVMAVSTTGATVFSGSVPLDATGRGEISSLSTGRYSVRVFSARYAPRALPVSVPGPTLEIPMTSGGRLEVRSDSPAAGRIVESSGGPYVPSLWHTDGVVNLTTPVATWENFAPGSYVLEVHLPSGDQRLSFSIAEGQTTTIEVK